MSVAEHVADGRCGCCGQALNLHWTPERMVDALQTWVREHGKLPRSTDWHHGRPHHPPHSLVCKVFGTWNNLVRAAGFTPHKCGQRPWTKDDIAEAMLDHLLRTGSWPSTVDWNGRADGVRRPHYQTVLSHFGTWRAAKLYAGWNGERPQPHIEARCSECDTELDNYTNDCQTCRDRQWGRVRRARKAETAASPIPSAATVSDERTVSA